MVELLRLVSLRNLRARPLRSFLLLLGIALGVALPSAIRIINRATLASLHENTEALGGKAALTVSAGQGGVPAEKLELISRVHGVKQAIPMVVARGFFAGRTQQKTLLILGVDLLKDSAVRSFDDTGSGGEIEDPLVFLNQPDSIMVTREFAEKNGLKVDSKIELATTEGKKAFTVRGLLSATGPAKAFGGAIAIMDIDGAQATFGRENKYDRVDLVLRPYGDPRAIEEQLRKELGPSYVIGPPGGQNESMERMIRSFQNLLSLFSQLALIVAFFLIANSVATSVAERTREIGTLRAYGTTRRRVFVLFVAEAAVLGVLGSALGAALGYGIALLLVDNLTLAVSTQVVSELAPPPLRFGLGDLLYAVGVGAGTAVLAAAWPSRKAARVAPVEAMRDRVAEDQDGTGAGSDKLWRFRIWAGAACLGWFAGATAFLRPWLPAPVQGLNVLFAVVGAALLGPVAVDRGLALLRSRSSRGRAFLFTLAADNLLRARGRTAVNVVTLITGLTFVILIAAMNVSFHQTLGGWLDAILGDEFLISSSGNLVNLDVQPLGEKVREAIGRPAAGHRYLQTGFRGQTVAIKASDAPDPKRGHCGAQLIDRPEADACRDVFSGEPTVLVSENFAQNFGFKTGDTLPLDTPTGTYPLRIVGIAVDYGSPTGVLLMNRVIYRKMFRDDNVTVFSIKLDPGEDVATARAELERRLGPTYGLLVTQNSEIKKLMLDTVDQTFAYLNAIQVAALLVALIGLMNTLIVSVMERYREIGVLRAIGMSRGQLQRLILFESGLQGVLGSVTALALGSWIAQFWMSRSLSAVLGWIIVFHYPWPAVVTTLLEGLVVALLAGVLPARRAGRLEIQDAIQERG